MQKVYCEGRETIMTPGEAARLIQHAAAKRFIAEHGIKALAHATYNEDNRAFEFIGGHQS